MAESHVKREAAMNKKYSALVIVMIILMTAGCATYGALEEDYGNSYRSAKSGQTLNPGASKNLAPVAGISGSAADQVVKKYTDSFAPSAQTPQQAPMGLMPLSSSGTGMGQNGYGQK
jgi:hypothetical protein